MAKDGHFTFIDGLSELFSIGTSSENSSPQIPGRVCLRDASVQNTEAAILECLDSLSSADSRKAMLLVDGLDLLLASTSTTSLEVLDMVMEWREVVDLCSTSSIF